MQIDPTNPAGKGNNDSNDATLALSQIAYRRFSKERGLHLDHKDLLVIPVKTKRGSIVDVNVAIHQGYLVASPDIKTVINEQGFKKEIKLEAPYQELIFPAQAQYQKAKGEVRAAFIKQIAEAVGEAANFAHLDRKKALQTIIPKLKLTETPLVDKKADIPFGFSRTYHGYTESVAAFCRLTGKLPPKMEPYLGPESFAHAGVSTLSIFNEAA